MRLANVVTPVSSSHRDACHLGLNDSSPDGSCNLHTMVMLLAWDLHTVLKCTATMIAMCIATMAMNCADRTNDNKSAHGKDDQAASRLVEGSTIITHVTPN